MLLHKISIWYEPGHDEELARKDAREQWYREVEKRGHMPYENTNPRVHLVKDSSTPPIRTPNSAPIKRGFRVSVQGYILPKLVTT